MVAACCERAERCGAAVGMPISVARSLIRRARVRIEPHTPERDADALLALAIWAQRFSPLVAVDPPDGLLLDVSGCARLFGGEDRLVAVCAGALDRHTLHARIAIAPSFGCAWAVARCGTHRHAIVPDGAAGSAMRDLPVWSLRLDREIVAQMAEVGLDRVGQVMDLPRHVLPGRFGRVVLLRLDQALGSAIELIEPVRPLAPPRASLEFDGPSTQPEAIEQATRVLLGSVCDELRGREAGARRICIVLERSDERPLTLVVSLARPCRDAKHLWSLIRPRLERAPLGFGVVGLAVHAERIASMPHEQAESWGTKEQVHDAADRAVLVDTLVNRLGRAAVCYPQMRASHLPERAFEMEMMVQDSPAVRASVPLRETMLPRPTLLLPRPEPASVISLTPDGPVRRLAWSGGDHEVIVCLGPERIACEWWRRIAPTRDYFAVQVDTGRWLWICRQLETGRWFVHGLWA